MTSPLRFAVPALLLGLAACAGAPGPRVGFDALIDDLATYDVVVLGEEHDNDIGHAQHQRIIEALHERRPDLVISMEMFERDVQEVLDAYLAEDIDEDEFLETSRPVSRYRRHYRQFVEFAKEEGLRVVAANAPRPLARALAMGDDAETILADPNVASETSAPKDRYWELFQEAMEGHGRVEEESMYAFYRAQCLKDDTMAESIVEAIRASDGRPMVVHIVGKFHSDDRLGTVARIESRMPELKIAVLSMESYVDAYRTGDGEFLLRVPVQLEIPKPRVKHPMAAGDTEESADPDAADGRPDLGFMPNYDDAVLGVLVDMLVEGGPAEQAGLEEGDVIIKVADRTVDSVRDYMDALADLTIGQTVQIEIMRGDEKQTLDVVVGQRSQ